MGSGLAFIMAPFILAEMREHVHAAIDRRNAEADRLIARRLRWDPKLLRAAHANLKRWIAKEGKEPAPVLLEWALILDVLTRTQLADFLERGTSKARRLRQSTPFMGLLTERERQKVERAYAKKAN